jgi:hypothetical protein
MTILRESVTSSNVASLGYDSETQRLEVAFKPNIHGVTRIFAYAPVLPVEWDAMMQPGASIGRAVARLVTHGGITATLVGEIRDGQESRIL